MDKRTEYYCAMAGTCEAVHYCLYKIIDIWVNGADAEICMNEVSDLWDMMDNHVQRAKKIKGEDDE